MHVTYGGTLYTLVHMRDPIYQVIRQTDGAMIGTIDILDPRRSSESPRAEVGELRGVAKQIERQLLD